MKQEFTITAADEGARLDVFLTANLDGFSRSKLQAYIKEGRVLVNDAKVTPHYALEDGFIVAVDLPDPTAKRVGLKPRPDITLTVVHEDDDVMVVDKPSGMIVHPAVDTDDATLVNALVARNPEIAAVGDSIDRPGIVHRLDKDASGLMVIAKNQDAFDALKAQFQEHAVKKEYTVLVDGGPPQDSGTVTLAIGRKKGDGKMAARPEPKEGDREAITHYVREKQFMKAALLTVRTETGRTHQIRAHMHAIGCSVVGDPLYGEKRVGRLQSPRLFLHAKTLAFTHPKTGKPMSFEAPLPTELQAVLRKLEGTEV